MQYILIPSLEHITIVKIATELWNEDDIKALISKFSFHLLLSEKEEKWQEIEKEILEKVLKLPQPKLFNERISGTIKPIGLQILKWVEFNLSFLDRDCVNTNLSKLIWTPQGAVDRKKTAEVLIKDENLGITVRYRIACVYCLENDILKLWGEMPEDLKGYFYVENHPRSVKENEMVKFWTYHIKGELYNMNHIFHAVRIVISPYQCAFEAAVSTGNKAATEYFFQKLTTEEEKKFLVTCTKYVTNRGFISVSYNGGFPNRHYDGVLCFLLSQMNEVQRMQVFKAHRLGILKCFLDWPWQSHFLEMANHVWDFLTEEDFYVLLNVIVEKIRDGYMDYYSYENIFGELWQRSSTTHKKYVINQCCVDSLLSNLFAVNDEESIKLILKDARRTEKNKLIFCYILQNISPGMSCGYEWDLLEFLVRECVHSKNDMINFKQKFKKLMILCPSTKDYATQKEKWNKIYRLLDDLICGYGKRKHVEDNDC